MENLDGSGLTGVGKKNGHVYLGAGTIYALGRRFSIQAHLRYHSWKDHQTALLANSKDANVKDTSFAFGIGLAVHF